MSTNILEDNEDMDVSISQVPCDPSIIVEDSNNSIDAGFHLPIVLPGTKPVSGYNPALQSRIGCASPVLFAGSQAIPEDNVTTRNNSTSGETERLDLMKLSGTSKTAATSGTLEQTTQSSQVMPSLSTPVQTTPMENKTLGNANQSQSSQKDMFSTPQEAISKKTCDPHGSPDLQSQKKSGEKLEHEPELSENPFGVESQQQATLRSKPIQEESNENSPFMSQLVLEVSQVLTEKQVSPTKTQVQDSAPEIEMSQKRQLRRTSTQESSPLILHIDETQERVELNDNPRVAPIPEIPESNHTNSNKASPSEPQKLVHEVESPEPLNKFTANKEKSTELSDQVTKSQNSWLSAKKKEGAKKDAEEETNHKENSYIPTSTRNPHESQDSDHFQKSDSVSAQSEKNEDREVERSLTRETSAQSTAHNDDRYSVPMESDRRNPSHKESSVEHASNSNMSSKRKDPNSFKASISQTPSDKLIYDEKTAKRLSMGTSPNLREFQNSTKTEENTKKDLVRDSQSRGYTQAELEDKQYVWWKVTKKTRLEVLETVTKHQEIMLDENNNVIKIETISEKIDRNDQIAEPEISQMKSTIPYTSIPWMSSPNQVVPVKSDLSQTEEPSDDNILSVILKANQSRTVNKTTSDQKKSKTSLSKNRKRRSEPIHKWNDETKEKSESESGSSDLDDELEPNFRGRYKKNLENANDEEDEDSLSSEADEIQESSDNADQLDQLSSRRSSTRTREQHTKGSASKQEAKRSSPEEKRKKGSKKEVHDARSSPTQQSPVSPSMTYSMGEKVLALDGREYQPGMVIGVRNESDKTVYNIRFDDRERANVWTHGVKAQSGNKPSRKSSATGKVSQAKNTVRRKTSTQSPSPPKKTARSMQSRSPSQTPSQTLTDSARKKRKLDTEHKEIPVFDTKFQIGDTVLALWPHDRFYYRGVVKNISPKNKTGIYNIQFDDKSKSWTSDVKDAYIPIGTTVMAMSPNDEDYVRGTIVSEIGDKYVVKFTEASGLGKHKISKGFVILPLDDIEEEAIEDEPNSQEIVENFRKRRSTTPVQDYDESKRKKQDKDKPQSPKHQTQSKQQTKPKQQTEPKQQTKPKQTEPKHQTEPKQQSGKGSDTTTAANKASRKGSAKDTIQSTMEMLGKGDKAATPDSFQIGETVLALWPNDKYFYRGVIKEINPNKNAPYLIQFDDKSKSWAKEIREAHIPINSVVMALPDVGEIDYVRGTVVSEFEDGYVIKFDDKGIGRKKVKNSFVIYPHEEMLSSESEQSDVDMSPKKQSKKEDKKSVRPTSSKRKKSNEQESDEESADEEFHTPQQAKSATNFEIGQTVLALWPNDKYYYRGVIKSINLNSKKGKFLIQFDDNSKSRTNYIRDPFIPKGSAVMALPSSDDDYLLGWVTSEFKDEYMIKFEEASGIKEQKINKSNVILPFDEEEETMSTETDNKDNKSKNAAKENNKSKRKKSKNDDDEQFHTPKLPPRATLTSPIADFKIGQAVLALYGTDKYYYRGIVKNIKDENGMIKYYVLFDDKSKVWTSNLRQDRIFPGTIVIARVPQRSGYRPAVLVSVVEDKYVVKLDEDGETVTVSKSNVAVLSEDDEEGEASTPEARRVSDTFLTPTRLAKKVSCKCSLIHTEREIRDIFGPCLENDSQLLSGHQCLITGGGNDYKTHAKAQVLSLGGKVINEFDDIQKGYKVVLFADMERRTYKYLQAMVAGYPCVKHAWLADISKLLSRGTKDKLPTILDSAYCLCKPSKKKTLFRGQSIAVIGNTNFSQFYTDLLVIAGASNILDKASLRTLFESDSQESGCDFVLAEDTEAVPAKVHMLGIPVVSVEWLFDSIKGEKLLPC
eukprot:m.9412 g.9412  ORF g.9412 m.9412 type:complete len:1841 (+) comp4063_c0_seq1:49-5571(+)